ncbi:MAG: hypothetical protein QOG19_2797 [Mycobacterium sp.]|nr:hypothetical protein [Mycobacterium sp.]
MQRGRGLARRRVGRNLATAALAGTVDFCPAMSDRGRARDELPNPEGGRRFTSESRDRSGNPSSALAKTAITG